MRHPIGEPAPKRNDEDVPNTGKVDLRTFHGLKETDGYLNMSQ